MVMVLVMIRVGVLTMMRRLVVMRMMIGWLW